MVSINSSHIAKSQQPILPIIHNFKTSTSPTGI